MTGEDHDFSQHKFNFILNYLQQNVCFQIHQAQQL